MFAVLGEISFEVVGSPETLTASRGYDYAEQRVVQDRPRLQWMADELETLRLEMLLHRSFTDPAATLLVLQRTAETHAALPLVFGNGDFRGYFVITQIDTLSRLVGAFGDPLAITVRLVLREWPPEFDPAAPPIPSFAPIAIVAAGSSGSAASVAASLAAAGVSALLAIAAPAGAAGLALKPDDVSPATIVRSA